MTKYVLLHIDDDTEATRLVRDAAENPDSPILTPCQENTVMASVVAVLPASIEALAAQWKADADALESDGFYPLHVRYPKDGAGPAEGMRQWDEQKKAQAFGMRWCAGQLLWYVEEKQK